MRLRLRVSISIASIFLFAVSGAAQTGIVAFGDSNTAGFGVARHEAFPAQLEGMLRAAGDDVRVFNAGVSGDTFVAMLARLDHCVPAGTPVAIVQGGYNDVQRRSVRSLLQFKRSYPGFGGEGSRFCCAASFIRIGTRLAPSSRGHTAPSS